MLSVFPSTLFLADVEHSRLAFSTTRCYLNLIKYSESVLSEDESTNLKVKAYTDYHYLFDSGSELSTIFLRMFTLYYLQ